MQRQRRSRAKLRRNTAGQANEPAFRVMTVGMDVQNPVIPDMPQELKRQVRAARDFDICIMLRRRRTGIDIKHTRLLSRPLHEPVRAPHVHGNSPVRWRIRTDKKHLHR